jgi:hypothetical protein
MQTGRSGVVCCDLVVQAECDPDVAWRVLLRLRLLEGEAGLHGDRRVAAGRLAVALAVMPQVCPKDVSGEEAAC